MSTDIETLFISIGCVVFRQTYRHATPLLGYRGEGLRGVVHGAGPAKVGRFAAYSGFQVCAKSKPVITTTMCHVDFARVYVAVAASV